MGYDEDGSVWGCPGILHSGPSSQAMEPYLIGACPQVGLRPKRHGLLTNFMLHDSLQDHL